MPQKKEPSGSATNPATCSQDAHHLCHAFFVLGQPWSLCVEQALRERPCGSMSWKIIAYQVLSLHSRCGHRPVHVRNLPVPNAQLRMIMRCDEHANPSDTPGKYFEGTRQQLSAGERKRESGRREKDIVNVSGARIGRIVATAFGGDGGITSETSTLWHQTSSTRRLLLVRDKSNDIKDLCDRICGPAMP